MKKRYFIVFLMLLTFGVSCTMHDYVDLGLPSGTLWATSNIGACSSTDIGDYYAWGEVNKKSKYIWQTYKHLNANAEDAIPEFLYFHLTKYCTEYYHGDNHVFDSKTQLELPDDVAYIRWGRDWRIPTKAQWEELFSHCDWNAVNMKGVNGYQVVGPSNKSIFLPATGFIDTLVHYKDEYGMYWSSSVEYETNRSYYAWALECCAVEHRMVYGYRCSGYAVRPVKAKK